MKFFKTFFLLVIFSTLVISAYSSNEDFEYKGGFDFENPHQKIKIHRFFDNGKKLLLVGNGNFQIWDIENNKAIKHYENPIGKAHRVSMMFLSPDMSKVVAFNSLGNTAEDDYLTVWDVQTSKKLKEIDTNLYPVNVGFWSKDGTKLITSNDASFALPFGYRFGEGGELLGNKVQKIEVSFWNSETLEHQKTISLENPTWRYLSNDAKVLLTTSGPKRNMLGIDYASEKAKFIDVWDTEKGKIVKSLPIGDKVFFTRTRKLGVSPNGKYLALIQKSRKRGSDDRMLVWKIDNLDEISEKPIYEIKANPKISDSDVKYSPDGKYVAIEAGKKVQIYELATGLKSLELKNSEMPDIWVENAFLDYGLKKIKFFDIQKDKKIFEQKLVYKTEEREVYPLVLDVDGNTQKESVIVDNSTLIPNKKEKVYLLYSNSFLEVFDFANGNRVATLISPDFNFKKKKYSKEKLIDSAGWAANGKLIYSFNQRRTIMKVWKYKGK